ncbi:MAG TPA: hypothetical protein VHC22_04400 [Pirellulales bacterium]|nr:hypothetical protein [Pirellulales bacterium]
MKRRSAANQQAAGVSLFPFLAVLLCTMGALIVVLVVIARHAQIQVAQAAKVAAAAAAESELGLKRSELQWRIDELTKSRDGTQKILDDKQIELSHIEEHSRRIRDKLDALAAARETFDELASGDVKENEELKKLLAKLHVEADRTRIEINELRNKSGPGGTSYAIIPYHGPNETRRRPIYVECRKEGIILQPEGIVLTMQDFAVDAGPGNPLAMALRTAGEYHRRKLAGAGAPYPLFLIRPDGIEMSYVGRMAIMSWGAEFGYELIGQDWPLEYPSPDPMLKLSMQQAVEEGRRRQQFLVHAAPRLTRGTGGHIFRAGQHGGLVQVDGSPSGGGHRGQGRPAGIPGGRRRGAGGYGPGDGAESGRYESSSLAGSGSNDMGDGPVHSIDGQDNPYLAAATGNSSAGGSGTTVAGYGSSSPGGNQTAAANGYGNGAAGGLGNSRSMGTSPGTGYGQPGSSTDRYGRSSSGTTNAGFAGGGNRLVGTGGSLASNGSSAGGGNSLPGGGNGMGSGGNGIGGGGNGLAGGGGVRGANSNTPAGGAGGSGGPGNGPGGLLGGPNATGGMPPEYQLAMNGGRGQGNSPGGLGPYGPNGQGRGANGAAGGGQGNSAGGDVANGGNNSTSVLDSAGGPNARNGQQQRGRPPGTQASQVAGRGGTGNTSQPGQGNATAGNGNGTATTGGNGPGTSDVAATGTGSPGSDGTNAPASPNGIAGATVVDDGTSGSASSSDGPSTRTGGAGGTAESGPTSGSSSKVAQSGGGRSAGGSGGNGGNSATRSRSSAGGNLAGSSNGAASSAAAMAQNQSNAQSSSSMGSSSSMMQSLQSGMPNPLQAFNFGQQNQQSSQTDQESVAKKRGEKNWANPQASTPNIPIERPIRIICDADHLTLMPEGRGKQGMRIIPLQGPTAESVDNLVGAVWDRIDSWGVAGRGMYWRPTLKMEVEPGGERRYAELHALLADSGFDVHGQQRPRVFAGPRRLRASR